MRPFVIYSAVHCDCSLQRRDALHRDRVEESNGMIDTTCSLYQSSDDKDGVVEATCPVVTCLFVPQRRDAEHRCRGEEEIVGGE